MRKSILVPGLSIAALVAIALACSGGSTAEAQSGGDRLLGLLPPNARAVFGLDAATARGSEIYRRFEEKMRQEEGDDIDELARKTGFDPRNDLDRVVVALWPGEGDDEAFLAVAVGQFARVRSSDAFSEHAKPVAERRGVTVYSGEGDESDDKAFAFLDDRTALLGSQRAVIDAIDRNAVGGPSVRDGSPLGARADAAAAAGQVWLVSQEPGELVDAPSELARRPEMLTILQNMRYLDLVADVRSGLRLDLEGVCRDASDARTLADAARGLLALSRLGRSEENAAFFNVLDTVSIRETGDTIEAGLSVTAVELDDLLEKMESQSGERAGF